MYSHRNLITLCLQRQELLPGIGPPIRAPVIPTSPTGPPLLLMGA